MLPNASLAAFQARRMLMRLPPLWQPFLFTCPDQVSPHLDILSSTSSLPTSDRSFVTEAHEPAPEASTSSPSTPSRTTNWLDGRPKLLMRDFIHNSLYHPTRGFFNNNIPVVGHLHNPINYWKIYCQMEFNMVVNQKYKELEVSFLTPAELFSPWYGHIMARHIFEHRKHNLLQEGQELIIHEIGGGNGTLARDILDWIRDNKPAEYEKTTYTCIEISSRLAAQQYETVVSKGGHSKHFRMHKGNAWDEATWGNTDYAHTFIIMMEVLDNLPHDRLVRSNPSEPWQQTVVVPVPGVSMEEGPWEEKTEAVSDDLVERCIRDVYVVPTWEDRMDKKLNKILDFLLANEPVQDTEEEVVFIPTASLALLDVLHACRPNHSLIAADFDKLPHVQVAGKNAPLVAEKVGGENIDHPTIFVPWGKADIFFPTDFDALARMYKSSAEEKWGTDTGKIQTAHYVQGAVMKRYREMVRTATICAFNPMVDDFRNARFFFGDSFKRSPEGKVDEAEKQQLLARLAVQEQIQQKQREEQQEALRARHGLGEKSKIGAGVGSSALPAWAQQKLKKGDWEQGQAPPPGSPPVLGGQKHKKGRA